MVVVAIVVGVTPVAVELGTGADGTATVVVVVDASNAIAAGRFGGNGTSATTRPPATDVATTMA